VDMSLLDIYKLGVVCSAAAGSFIAVSWYANSPVEESPKESIPPVFQYAGYPVAFGGGAVAGGVLGLAWPGLAVYRGTIVAKDWNNTLNEIRNTPPSVPFEAPLTTSVDYVTNGIKIASQTAVAPFRRFSILQQIRTMPNAPYYRDPLSSSHKSLVWEVTKNEGLSGLFRGNATVCLRLATIQSLLYSTTVFYTVLISSQTDGVVELSPATRAAILGACGGATRNALAYPLTTLSTHMSANFCPRTQQIKYRSIFDCLRQVGWQGEASTGQVSLFKKLANVSHLYRGLIPSTGYVALSEGILWGLNKRIREWLIWRKEQMDWLNKHTLNQREEIFSAALATTIGYTVAHPLDTIARRMQVNGSFPLFPLAGESPNKAYSSGFDCAAKILSGEGFAGLYRGLTARLLERVPFTVAVVLLVEQFMLRLREEQGKTYQESPVQN